MTEIGKALFLFCAKERQVKLGFGPVSDALHEAQNGVLRFGAFQGSIARRARGRVGCALGHVSLPGVASAARAGPAMASG